MLILTLPFWILCFFFFTLGPSIVSIKCVHVMLTVACFCTSYFSFNLCLRSKHLADHTFSPLRWSSVCFCFCFHVYVYVYVYMYMSMCMYICKRLSYLLCNLWFNRFIQSVLGWSYFTSITRHFFAQQYNGLFPHFALQITYALS